MIHLGIKDSESMAQPMSPRSNKVRYPSMHFTSKEPVKLPGGHAIVKYRPISVKKDMSDPANPKYHHELEVHGIEHKGMTSEAEPSMTDKLKSAMRKKMMPQMDAEDKADGGMDENTETE